MHGVHSHKVTDHHHYWEDGGATYHQRYTTFDLVRGQEGDKWKGDVDKLMKRLEGGEGREFGEVGREEERTEDGVRRGQRSNGRPTPLGTSRSSGFAA